ncbi:TetR/AcrR family transcriptional regulator [Spiractinospora alimapuensis]|uniref:TetR/AcrR family transcriptional regulator n=1 Tax=Spiractinospora alimapuensis TaxID=2820884 RepID=UPI001F2E3B15|nr:TetR/AcrR family transcriptional regulator [Spiractinospora alimapuensis]QVQ52246.1 TetR/AcrR family transcriptional regulator [Spiractinospora alimapuensis]
MSAAQSGNRPPGPVGTGTRERLVAAASWLLAEGGTGAVTLRAVGDRAGVSRSAPYRHFEDKDDLLTAVLLEAFRTLFEEMRHEMTATASAPERLRRGFRVYVRFGLSWPEHYLQMFGERMAQAERKRELAEVAPEGIGLLSSILAEGQKAGEIRSGDVRDLTILTWSAAHGLITFGISGLLAAKGLDLEDVLDQLITELVAGIEA